MSRSLYVGGLDEDVTEHVLRAAFIPFGNLKDAQLPLDKDGKSRGFAFIEFEEDEDAAAAIENMDGAELMGRAIRVNAAKPDKRGKQGRAIWADADEWFAALKDQEGGGGAGEAVGGGDTATPRRPRARPANGTVRLGPRDVTLAELGRLNAALDCWGAAAVGGGAWQRSPDGRPVRLWPPDAPWCASVDPAYYLDCGPDAGTPGSERGEARAWRWTPAAACPATPPWTSPTALCGLTRDVFFVGDSIQDELFGTLRAALGACDTRVKGTTCPGGEPLPEALFQRSDHLRADDETFYYDMLANVVHFPWLADVRARPDVSTLVLNRGAHYEPTDTMLVALGATLDAVARELPDVLVVFRDTPAGHAGCGATLFSAPALPNASAPIAAKYNWDKFPQQNLAVKAFLHAHHPGVLYLDVASMTRLRADSHFPREDDCLHYCMPGPIDAWVEMLHRALWAVAHIEELP